VALSVLHRPGAYEVVARSGEFTTADLALVLAALRAQKDDVLTPAQHLLGQEETGNANLSTALAALFDAGCSSVITVPIPVLARPTPPAVAPKLELGPLSMTSPVLPVPGAAGFIYVDSPTPGAILNDASRTALGAVARALSVGFAADEERHGLNAKLQHITRLYEISSSPVHTLDVEGVIDRSMEAMIQLTRAERGFLFLIEEDGIQCKVARGADGNPIVDPTLEVSWSIVRKVVDERRAVRVDDALSDRLLSSSVSVVDLSLRSVMCIPICSAEHLIGVAYVDNRSRIAQFNDDDLHVFELFGHQIAAALANAITYGQVNEANRLKAEFLSNISHELRTPLTSILGFAHCLRQQPLPAEAGQQVARIEESSEVLKDLVDRVLTFSALESNQLPVESTPFAVSGLVAELRSRFLTQAAAKGLDLRFDIAPEVPAWLVGDPNRLIEALRNLLDNAVKFTPEGYAALAIEAADQAVGEVTLRFTVEDSGIGIEGGDQGKVLDPFVQGDGSSTRRFGGMGLGLTTSARLVKVMGGLVELQSVPGMGTKVWFTLRFPLPMEPGAADAALPPF
jgi:signal transduction histidine kinase